MSILSETLADPTDGLSLDTFEHVGRGKCFMCDTEIEDDDTCRCFPGTPGATIADRRAALRSAPLRPAVDNGERKRERERRADIRAARRRFSARRDALATVSAKRALQR